MKVRDLIKHWEKNAGEPLTVEAYSLRLPVSDAARIRALAALYPRRNVEDIVTDLLTSALDEVEATLPYEQGTRVIAEDEQGDPIFEDAGPAAEFHRLAAQFEEQMTREVREKG